MQIDSSIFSQVSPRDAASLANPTSASTSASTAASANAAAQNAAIDSTSALANENTFLQLLVAQIKNQDPTQPMDSSTFLTQLAQFSSLEQLIGIRQDVSSLDASATAASTATTPTS